MVTQKLRDGTVVVSYTWKWWRFGDGGGHEIISFPAARTSPVG
jgi:hypothetical protein